LHTAYLGRQLVINWEDGLSEDSRPGPDLPPGTRVKVGPRYNERVYGFSIDDDRDWLTQDGMGEHKVLFVPKGSDVNGMITGAGPND
jgi:hypothetical protein